MVQYVQVSWLFEPRDVWVGLYIGSLNKERMYRDRTFYLIPFPVFGVRIKFVWEVCRACGKGWRWTGLHENRGCYGQCG